MEQYKFIGKISIKKKLISHLVGFIFTNFLIYLLFPYNFVIGISLFSFCYLILLGETLWRQKKSIAELTEYYCLIVEVRYFGLIKIKKKMDISDEEKESLKNYFRFLTTNTSDIKTFSITSLNKTIEENIKFKNYNAKQTPSYK